MKSRVFQEAPWHIYREGVISSPSYWEGYLIFIANIKIPPKIAIFFGVKHSSGHKTQQIVKHRVFQEAPWLIYREAVNYSPSYWGGYLIFIANTKIPPKVAIFFRVKYSSGQKTQVIVKNRIFQESPWLIYREGVNSTPPYWREYLILMQTYNVHRKTVIFCGVKLSPGQKTQ